MLPVSTPKNGAASFPPRGLARSARSAFRTAHTGPPEKVIIDRILSVSFMAALPPEEQEHVTSQLKEIIATYPELAGKAQVTFPYETLACSVEML